MSQFNLNWKPSPEDIRDWKFSSKFSEPITDTVFPESVDLTDITKDVVYDQLSLGSCTSQSTAMAVLHEYRTVKKNFLGSRLFLYYNTRVLYEDTMPNDDSGAYIRDVFKTLNKEGVCEETLCSHVISDFAKKPSQSAYENAKNHTSVAYYRLDNNLTELKTCLSQGKPFVFGFYVYESFMNGNWTEVMPIPRPTEKILGGHAILCCGFDNKKQAFKIKNSWGPNWKQGGYFWMPYSFITSNKCDDFWALEAMIDTQNVTPDPTPDPTPTPKEKTFREGVLELCPTYRDLKNLTEIYIVRIGKSLGLLTDVNLTKNQNLEIVQKELNLP